MPRTPDRHVPGSFRDPSGFLFWRDGVLYRQVEAAYAPHYEHLLASGLYRELVDDGLLIAHEEVPASLAAPREPWKCLRPEPLAFVSYPFEWCFSQLRDAALLTLDIQTRAMERGMILKDASAYNVQFRRTTPVLIDTLSFELYEEGRPWVAYRQFCENFLGPLALVSHRDARLGRLLALHIDGVPLDLVAELLPLRTRLRPSLALHIHLHAAGQRRWARRAPRRRLGGVSRTRLTALCRSLRSAVDAFELTEDTEWLEYYEEIEHYSAPAVRRKAELVEEYLEEERPGTVWDLGANTGRYAWLAAARADLTVALDADPGVVDRMYRRGRADDLEVLPLVIDLRNPSPGLGWAHRERDSLLARGPADVVLALALLHHLRVGNNVPFAMIAEFLSRAGRSAIVEFVPKDDPKVREMLAVRADVFPDYTQREFEIAFEPWFEIARRDDLPGSGRSLYVFRPRRESAR